MWISAASSRNDTNQGNSIYLFSVKNIPDKRAKRFMRGYRKRDAHLRGVEMRIKNQSKRRTSSKGAENKFSAYGEQVQKELRTSSKLAEMRIKENSLAQEKKFPWAREKILWGKRNISLGQENSYTFASFFKMV